MATNYRRKSAGNGATRFFAVLLALIMVLAIVFMSMEIWGTGKVKPSNWGKDEVADVVDPADPENPGTQPGEQDEHDASESHGMKLMAARIPIEMYEQYGISPASVESAYTITATIEPDNATNKEVDWTVYFKDESSEWATGKTVTDYVSISSTEAQCVVTCAQAFGEPIMVKVASHEDASIFATKQFDYVKRLPANLYPAIVTRDDAHAFGKYIIGSNSLAKVVPDYSNGNNIFGSQVGTVVGDVSIPQVTVHIKDTPLYNAINMNMINPEITSAGIYINDADYIMVNPQTAGNAVIPWTAFFKKSGGVALSESSLSTKLQSILKSIVKSAAAECDRTNAYDMLKLSTTIKLFYKGSLIEEKSEGINFSQQNSDTSSLTVGITDLKFEDSGNMFF